MRRLVALVALLVLAGCGKVTEVRERDVRVAPSDAVVTRDAPQREARGLRIANARIVFITHGQASDTFWTIVKRGLADAQRQTGTAVSYRAPDSFSLERMRGFIEEATVDKPDGMVVSLPDIDALAPSIRAAVRAGIPVVTINSGSDQYQRLGVLAHVGQPEFKAGFESGIRMGRAGVKRALCVNQESGNHGLEERCRGFAAGLRRSGGTSRELPIPLQNPATAQRRIASAITDGPVDGILTLGPGGVRPAMDAVRASGLDGRVTLATFDLSPDVLEDVRDGELLFAVDQQPYLQGYLPVILLAEQARHQIFPGRGELIPTGPQFVTEDNAAEVIRLSAEGVR
ncbi:MAG TPA: sugar ABC transporter substrate-binding protein [Solirubrobacter sp.]|nr:sugar ABC transporter substrate-binding protein [Solirubrobacter sp.]